MRKIKRKRLPCDSVLDLSFFELAEDICDGGLSAGAIAAIGAGISAAGTAASTAISAGAKWGSSTYLRVAKEMANYNNSIALRNWERENAYNSPAAQMERYKAAGLNPNLIYGQQNTSGSIQSGQASTNPSDYEGGHSKAEAAAGVISGLTGAYNLYQDLRLKQASVSNSEASAAAQIAKSNLDQARAEGQKIKNFFDEQSSNYKLETLNKKNAMLQIDLENKTRYDAEIYKTRLEKSKQDLVNSGLTGKKLEKELDKIDAEIASINNDIEQSKVRTQIVKWQVSIQDALAGSQIKLNDAQATKTNWDAARSFRGYQKDSLEYDKALAGGELAQAQRDYEYFKLTGKFPANMSTAQKVIFGLNAVADRISPASILKSLK